LKLHANVFESGTGVGTRGGTGEEDPRGTHS